MSSMKRLPLGQEESVERQKLPPAPSGFTCAYVGVNGTPSIDCPKKLPRRATHVATVEWAWTPWHNREDKFHLSTNKARSHWILWHGYFDDNESMKWEHFPYAYFAKKGVPAKTAAVYLLLEGWRGEMAEYGSPDEPFHFITGEGLLSAGELNVVAEVIWLTEEGAPRTRAYQTLDEPKTLADLEKLAQQMVKEGKMPPPEVFFEAMAKARKRWHKQQPQMELASIDSYDDMDAHHLLKSLVSLGSPPIELDDEE